MKTKIITYNLKERGRQYRGKERHFNIRAIVDAINGPECQERVKNRDMHGFYGHLTRLKFGMIPNEGVSDGISPVPKVIPAFVTTHLRAFDDGTVEHQAEFAKTQPGEVAARLFDSRMGGFSSAIDERRPTFFGFDFVLEPNFSTNRGYALDSVEGMTLDDVNQAILDEQLSGMMALLDSVNGERERASDVIERLSAENEQLLSMLATTGRDTVALDSAGISPIAVSVDAIERMQRDAAFFRAAALPSFVAPKAKEQEQPAVYDRLLSRFAR